MATEDEVEIAISEVEAAAKSARSLAEQLEAVRLVDVVDEIAMALSGGASAAAADTLAGRWNDRIRALATTVDVQAAALAGAARSYATQDESNATALGPGPL